MKNDPGHQEREALLRLFSEGQYPQAATLARNMTLCYPQHGFGWKVLGVVLKQLGQGEDSLEPLRKAVALMPTDADSHINLAVSLHELGRLVEAESSFRDALEIRPDFAEAQYCLGNTLRDMGRMVEAEACYRLALRNKPDFVDAYGNLGYLMLQSGRLDEAEAAYRRALEVTPDCAESNYNLGNTLRDLGRIEEAEACYRMALCHKPDLAEAYGNLSFVLRKLGRLEDAEAICRQAIEAVPDIAYAHFNLGSTLQDLGRSEEAKVAYRQALQINPGLADAHCNLASMSSDCGQVEEALAHYRKALDVSPSLLAARLGISSILSRLVPHWHVPMMNDQRRNHAYFAALEAAITADAEVFEIGTGSGLVAMMAAKLGVKRVTSCEAVPLIAETARRIVADNGYEPTITVIAKRSTDVHVGADLFRKADILVSEIFSSELLGEHVLPSIEDAKQRLLKPRGRVIPAAGSIMIALFGDGDLTRNVVVQDSFGFNLQRFNSIISEKQATARNDLKVAMLSDDIEAFRFDFQHDSFFPSQTRSLRIPIKATGRCYGIIQWIRLQMVGDIRFENHPSEQSPVSNWQHCTYVFAEPVDVEAGQIALVSAAHNRIVPWFSLDDMQDS